MWMNVVDLLCYTLVLVWFVTWLVLVECSLLAICLFGGGFCI